MKQNCWEFKKCGREIGGEKEDELGVCPAAALQMHDGKNNGKNAGRYCWAVSGTFCEGEIQGSFAKKITNCVLCDFFQHVVGEEGRDFRK